jgi:HrpA-like RNA helicase
MKVTSFYVELYHFFRFFINDRNATYVHILSLICFVPFSVHERDVNTDFLLILVKHLLKEHPTFKVVLMSATLNAKIFSDYFREFGCSSIVIPGRAFPVTAFFLEDVLALTGFQPEAGSDCVLKSKPFRKTDEQAGGQSEAQKRAVWAKRITTTLSGTYAPSVIQTLLTLDESVVNTALIAQLVSCICSGSSPGAVLVFVPGIAEIREIVDILSETLNPHTTRVLPLHSSLSTVEQQRVFEILPSTLRKIVVATNIAETSITIPDVVRSNQEETLDSFHVCS